MTDVDPVLLRSFTAVAREASFTRAAAGLGLRQSTVSQHVRRLEELVGCTLLDRDTHSVALTADGEAMLEYATTILDAGERALAHFRGARVHGRLRFGVSEDLVLTRVPTILADFRRRHPAVDVELTVGLSETLEAALDRGELDLVFAKRSPDRTGGTPVWPDRFVWVGAPGTRLDPDLPVPLVSYPSPSLSRAAAIAALEATGRAWRPACTSGSLSGLRAAALAGLGVVAHAQTLVPPGLVPVAGLPTLGEFEFTLQTGRRALTPPTEALAHTITTRAATLRTPPP